MYPYSQPDFNYEPTANQQNEGSTRPLFLDQLDAAIANHTNSSYDSHKRHDSNPHRQPRHDHGHDRDHGHGHESAPKGPPPAHRPNKNPSLKLIDANAIRGCLYSQTYLYLKNGSSFWIFPTYVGHNSLSGFRWTRRRGWVYFGLDLSEILSFSCGRF